MKVLKYNKLFFSSDFIGIFIACYVSIIAMGAVTSSLVFMIHHPELKYALDGCLMICAAIQTQGAYQSVRLNTTKVTAFYAKLQNIINKGKILKRRLDRECECSMKRLNWNLVFAATDGEEASIYRNVEEKCRKIAKMAAYFVLVHPSAVVPTVIYSVICIANGTFDVSKFFLPFHMAIPFDTTKMFGFYALCAFQYNLGLVYIFCMISTTSYFVCCCLYVEAICNQFNCLIQSFGRTFLRCQKKKNDEEFHALWNKAINEIKSAVELHVGILE